MILTLSDGTTTLSLPPDLRWDDEYTWNPVIHDAGYSLTGALIVEIAEKQAGRPITLQSEADCAWLSGADVAQLNTWARTAGQVLTLILRNATYQIMFRHSDAPAFDAPMVIRYGDPESYDRFSATIKLMEI